MQIYNTLYFFKNEKTILFLSSILLLFACQQKQNTKTVSTGLTSEEKINSIKIKSFYDTVLTNGKSHDWLRYLTQTIGGRLSGSVESQQAVEWGEQLMRKREFDLIYGYIR